MRLAASRRNRTAEDQRMLIYCSNDFHFFLPSYDEAMRSRPAEPPPFDAVVNEADGATQNDAAGMCGVFALRTSKVACCLSGVHHEPEERFFAVLCFS